MFTIIQHGYEENTWYTLQVLGQDLDHFTTLTAAANALELIKAEFEEQTAQTGGIQCTVKKEE